VIVLSHSDRVAYEKHGIERSNVSCFDRIVEIRKLFLCFAIYIVSRKK